MAKTVEGDGLQRTKPLARCAGQHKHSGRAMPTIRWLNASNRRVFREPGGEMRIPRVRWTAERDERADCCHRAQHSLERVTSSVAFVRSRSISDEWRGSCRLLQQRWIKRIASTTKESRWYACLSRLGGSIFCRKRNVTQA